MKNLIKTSALLLAIAFAGAASAVTVSQVQSNTVGTTRTVGTSTGVQFDQSVQLKTIALNSGLADVQELSVNSQTTYTNQSDYSNGTFNGGSNYQVVGNNVVGTSWENSTEVGASRIEKSGSFENFKLGVERTYSGTEEVESQRLYTSTGSGSFNNTQTTNFTTTTAFRNYFAQ